MMKFMMINIPFGPTILKTFNMNVFPEKPIKFFYDVVLQTINSRKEAKSRRNDLVDMMIDAVKGDLEQVWSLTWVVPRTYKPSAPHLTLSVYLCSSRRNAQGKVEFLDGHLDSCVKEL